MKLTVKFNVISGDKMHISGYLSPGIGRGKKRNFEDDGNAYIWIVVAACTYPFVKILQTVPLKCVHFIVYKLYLIKLILKYMKILLHPTLNLL